MTTRKETIDTLDDAIQLLCDLGRRDVADEIYDVLLNIDSLLVKNQNMPAGVVIELFAAGRR
jgi:hypothetical protein